MKKDILITQTVFYILVFITITSCSKTTFLDAKPQKNLVVPTSILDFQALLENDGGGTVAGLFNITPGLGESSSDNYYLPDSYYQSTLSTRDKNLYIWNPEIFSGTGNQADWNKPYAQILTANIAIEGLNKVDVTTSNLQLWNNTYGDALFKRAYAFWNLAQVFCPPYDSATAKADLGLPLKLNSDINQNSSRSTVLETYEQILQDLTIAVDKVSFSFTGHLNRASKPAVYALMARICLSMRAYDKALLYADSSLRLYSGLIDYNSVSTTSTQPFVNTNAEVLYQSFTTSGVPFAAASNASPDSNLYRSYSNNDLRSLIFFRISATNFVSFKYGYEGVLTNYQFTGLTSSEMYLIRSECYARAGNTASALADLNTLLLKRWKTNTFAPIAASNAPSALSLILSERRKELIFRGLRWMDLRRLNKEGYAITPKRVIAGQTYIVPPNSPLYTLPIPPDEIALSGIVQNKR